MHKWIKKIFTLFAVVLFISAAGVSRAELPEADELVKKMHDAEAALKSYSYTIRRKDLMDDTMDARLRAGFSDHKVIVETFSKAFSLKEEDVSAPDVDRKARHYKSMFKYMFIKPYLMQTNIAKSDYLPSIMMKADLVYRPDMDPAYFFVRMYGSGITMKREVSEESGGFMGMNWEYLLMELDCALVNGGKMVVSGTEKVMGRESYVLEVALAGGRVPYAVGCGGNDYGAPEEIHTQINRDFDMLTQRMDEYGSGMIRYNIDTETHLILQKEEIYNVTTGVLFLFTDIKLNKTTKADLLTPEVGGKKE